MVCKYIYAIIVEWPFPLFLFFLSRSLAPVSFHGYSMVFVHNDDDDDDYGDVDSGGGGGGGGCCCSCCVHSPLVPRELIRKNKKIKKNRGKNTQTREDGEEYFEPKNRDICPPL